jgi:transposase
MSKFQLDFLESYDESAILAELRRIATYTGRRTVTKADIEKYGRMSYAVVNKRFHSLRQALQQAGLDPHRFMKANENELLEILVELWTKTLEKEGRRPYRTDLAKYGFPVSSDTIVRKLGLPWKKALRRAYDYVSETGQGEQGGLGRESGGRQGIVDNQGPRKAISIRKRFLVFKRDNYTCQICHRSGLPIEVDHIKPWARNGPETLDNLQTLCFACNRGKRDSAQ